MKEITVAHSPDSDDAFMFYALVNNKIDTGDLKFVNILSDIETLNRKAFEGVYDVTAISFHAYAYVSDKYMLMPCGASMGIGYGPILVAKKKFSPSDLKDLTIGVPGTLTSAFLILKIFEPNVKYKVIQFDKIIDAVLNDEIDAGLLIHEGQLTYSNSGLVKLIDFGEWWYDQTGLPLPLGGNAIKKELGIQLMKKVSRYLYESVKYALENRYEALKYALQFARGMDDNLADKFVGMYVNELTLDYGEDGRKAVQLFLDLGFERGLIPNKVKVEFVEY
ncbi:1,4-dihydroxy-6-naphthoate synthase [Candidatus Kryptonium thompsonii]|uniref:1,4-dihydroxy-6-naphtoate synthase n=1 Tax=Candidatus Kryptonium thompsonii TaxID=1633631 RepID=A0A0N7MQ40_9BACT|nr:MqnA/MqnD/SBP family protein [Candidatus Kryptonium thompsoni]CUS80779.1 1,4-dihydroxy-6-naphthoate synthase [Candidatus Kryptonium thompsoni]CUS81567.1 1,4-dihydroxy-6-naphthoate synthase [Candidatus Kryptonium thompsoni]CUS82059.1 1,4-dihydroxy-6-naphthoate synthase [Candidatus Kryptonium thompsoni]CUS83739.1 1,4-dihydroxy-6-naphthoate synthase [Candidatus Kryptonium thompsoni]CUS94976.1 1,4-dihydroxy-6-naphthoate synthase [Candidatus Kryptonium thompsoni]